MPSAETGAGSLMGGDHDTAGIAPHRSHGRWAGDVPYWIRPFELDDLGAVQSLFAAVRGTEPDRAWLTWKFLRNPAIRDECIFVADSPDGIIGIVPLYPLRLRYGSTPIDATCVVNAMVHPEYRGMGVFSALRHFAKDYLSDRTDLMFGFTNSNSRPIYRHWGKTEVSPMHARFRVQNPAAVFPGGRLWRTPLAYLHSVATRAHLAVRDRRSSTPQDVSVSRTESVPADRLAGLYRSPVPDALHVVRDAAYYRWRLGAPDRAGAVYIATIDGEDVAAIVTRLRRVNDTTTRLEVADVLPLSADRTSARGLAAILDSVIRDHRDADVISIQDSSVPEGVLRARGFVSNARFPYSLLCARVYVTLTLFVTPFTDTAFDVADPDNWNVNELTINTD